MKVEEVLKKITELQHVVAVYIDVLEYLEEYLPSDFGDDGEVIDTITVEEPCISPVVAADAIDMVYEKVTSLKEEAVGELNNLRLLETGNAKRTKPGAKRPTTGRKSSGKSSGK